MSYVRHCRSYWFLADIEIIDLKLKQPSLLMRHKSMAWQSNFNNSNVNSKRHSKTKEFIRDPVTFKLKACVQVLSFTVDCLCLYIVVTTLFIEYKLSRKKKTDSLWETRLFKRRFTNIYSAHQKFEDTPPKIKVFFSFHYLARTKH